MLVQLTLQEYADRLASSEPAPGGGSAAALSGVTGTALLEMALRLTLGKCREQDKDDLTRELRHAGAVRGQLLALVDKDAAAFAQVIAAYRLPKDTESGKSERHAAIQAALQLAAEIPLETARACLEVLKTAQRLLGRVHAEVISDLMVGAANAEAGVTGALLNTAINLPLLKDKSLRATLGGEIHSLRVSSEDLMREIRSRVYNEDTFTIMQV